MTIQHTSKRTLAEIICNEFKEPQKIELYENLFKQYDEKVIRNAFEDVKKVPLEKIKKSQSALFIYLIKKYASTQNKNS